MSVKLTTLAERKRRLEGVQHALLVLGDGKEYSARELFERPENATSESSGYTKADLAWQTKALTTLHDLGLIVRTGAHGPTRKYRLTDGASLDHYLDDEGAARLLWHTGMDALRATPRSETPPPPDPSEPAVIDAEPVEGDAAAEEEASPVDPSQALLGKLLAVLEGFDARLAKIETRGVAGNVGTTTALATRDDLGDAAVQILQLLDPRLEKIEKEVASVREASAAVAPSPAAPLDLPTVTGLNARSIRPALEGIEERLMNLDSALHALQTDMTKQVNRTQDAATKQLVDKKRYEDLCARVDALGNACEQLINYTARMISSLRAIVHGESGRYNDAVLTGLIDFSTKKGGGA